MQQKPHINTIMRKVRRFSRYRVVRIVKKQLLTSHHVQDNLNVFLKIPKPSRTKNADPEISFQSALKSVRQAKVLLTVSIMRLTILITYMKPSVLQVTR